MSAIDLAMFNGGPATGELGSSWSQDRLFTRIEGNKLFTLPDLDVNGIDDMLRMDGKARALEQILTLPLRFATWQIAPREGDTGEAEFVREALTTPDTAGGMSTPMDLVIAQMTSACLYRVAFFEKVWKVNDAGRVIYDKIAFRSARTCAIPRSLDDQSFQGFEQRFRKGPEMVQVLIPPEKAVVFIHGQHRDPLNGISDLDTCRSIFETKQKVRFLWYSFLENQSMPKAIARHDVNDDTAVNDFARRVSTLKGGSVLGLHPGQDVTAFESSGNGAAQFQAAMDFLTHEQAESTLTGFLDLTARAGGGRGSFSLSRDQSDLYMQGREAILSEMAAVIRTWIVAPLVAYNFGSSAVVPDFTFGKLAEQAAAEAETLLSALATSQSVNPAIPDVFVELLTEKVAGYVDIDVDQVHRAIEAKQQQAPGTPTAQLQAGIAAAAQLVQSSGVAAVPVGAPG